MSEPLPLQYVFYFAADPAKVWDGFVSAEANRVIFLGADFHADLRVGGAMSWGGPGPDGKPMTYVRGQILAIDAPRRLEYTFAMAAAQSRVTVELVPESEATRVRVTHDQWTEGDPAYAQCVDGWPRILSRLKTLIETGKTFKPH
jgi:uncharacterized protein YndB with AHSA1/START domain